MVEIISRVVPHADPFHHAARANVGRHRERHHLVEIQRVKRTREHRLRAFHP
jgi:hypothetical protein